MNPSSTRSRWMDWTPKARILADPAERAPTKPSKAGSVGFDGDLSKESSKIEGGPELMLARTVLTVADVRLLDLDGGRVVGIWSDLDCPKVRAALQLTGENNHPVRYLDGGSVPACYKSRRVPGEPVPMAVLTEMERSQADFQGDGGPMEGTHPWTIRDRMLNEMGWSSKGTPWEWKAAAMKRLFKGQGATWEGRATAATVRHRERKASVSNG